MAGIASGQEGGLSGGFGNGPGSAKQAGLTAA